jgi:hypothetical protein
VSKPVERQPLALSDRAGHNNTLDAPAKPRSKTQQRKLERRARWILRELDNDPTYKYTEIVDAVREQFGCGYGAAQAAYAYSRELEREWLAMLMSPERLVSMYMRLHDLAVADKKYNAARAVLDSVFDKTGMSAPAKHEFTVAGARTVQQMAHITVLGMTPNQRAQREAELRAKTTKAALARVDDRGVIDVGDNGAVVEPPPPTFDEAMAELDAATGPGESEPDDDDAG